MSATATTTKFDVVRWMADHGHPGYANEINALECTINEIKGDAGRYWDQCEFTRGTIAKIRDAIETVRREAQDRYDDWVSDIDF